MITCPNCDTKFLQPNGPWDDGNCPTCGKEYYWVENFPQDESGCWDDCLVLTWEKS